MLRVRQTNASPVSEQEVEILMEEGARAGVFEKEERELVARALRLDDRPVRELMTPRPSVVWLDADEPPEEVLRLARESRHSYFPVARGDLDNLLEQLMEQARQQSPEPLSQLEERLERDEYETRIERLKQEIESEIRRRLDRDVHDAHR